MWERLSRRTMGPGGPALDRWTLALAVVTALVVVGSVTVILLGLLGAF